MDEEKNSGLEQAQYHAENIVALLDALETARENGTAKFEDYEPMGTSIYDFQDACELFGAMT